MNFSGKVILITGGSSGIGAGSALHLSKLGASLAIVGRNANRLSDVAKSIRETGSADPFEIVADVTTDAERIISATIQRFGKLDVLVNNAGILVVCSEPLGTLEAYDQIMNTNVRSVLALTKLAVPHLEKTKGNVVNISSIAAVEIVPDGIAYAMSKAALDHFTRNAAVDLAAKGIRVNAVSPGAIVTPIFESAGLNKADAAKFIEHCNATYPVGRVGNVSDTSNAIAFLAHDTASFITGHILTVDGGKHFVSK